MSEERNRDNHERGPTADLSGTKGVEKVNGRLIMGVDPETFLNKVRVACLRGAVILRLPEDVQSIADAIRKRAAEQMDIVGTVLDSGDAKTEDLALQSCEVPVLNPTGTSRDPNRSKYLERLRRYGEIHTGGRGPGLITVAEPSDLRQLTVLSGPILMEVPDISAPNLRKAIKDAVGRHLIEGIICSRDADISTISGMNLGCPVFLQGETDQVADFLETDGAGYCDGFVLTGLAKEEERTEIQRRLLSSIKGRAREIPDQTDTRIIRVGMLDVQGAGALDKKLFEHVATTMGENVEVVLLYTGEQIRASRPDLIVCPGGWHGPQLNRYRLWGVIEEIKNRLRENIPLGLECAGAIAFRNREKESPGCLNLPEPAHILDVGVTNDRFNGTLPMTIRPQGSSEIPTMGIFSSAPEFTRLGRGVESLATLTGEHTDSIVAVLQEGSGDHGDIFASAAHNPSLTRILLMLAREAKSHRQGEGLV